MRTDIAAALKLEFRNLRVALRSFDMTLQKVVASNSAEPAPKARPMRRLRLSAKARASLFLQGRYMGYMRQLKPRQKAKVRKVREAKGVRAAIAIARRYTARDNQ